MVAVETFSERNEKEGKEQPCLRNVRCKHWDEPKSLKMSVKFLRCGRLE